MSADSEQFDRIMKHLTMIHDRITQIANMEAKAAWMNGYGANGQFWPEEKASIEKADALLEQWAGMESEA